MAMSAPWEISGVTLGDDFLATFIDLTSRKQAEEKLRIASLYARSLIEASLDRWSPSAQRARSPTSTRPPRRPPVFHEASSSAPISADYFTEPEQARTGYRQVFNQGFVRDIRSPSATRQGA